MTSLIDRDQTRAREEEYPDTAGNAIKQITHPILEAHASAGEKYVDWVQELLKRDDVHFAVKLAILGGEDPLTFGGSLPAVMMARLEQLGVQHAKISGGMTVTESNKASEAARTSVQSVTNAGVGTAFWHVNEQLNVQHGTKSAASRATDYRARIDWEVELAPMGEAEGVGLIKESVGKAFEGVQKLNQTLADAKLEEVKKQMKSPPSSEDADDFLGKTDTKDLLTGDDDKTPIDGGDDDDSSGDDS